MANFINKVKYFMGLAIEEFLLNWHIITIVVLAFVIILHKVIGFELEQTDVIEQPTIKTSAAPLITTPGFVDISNFPFNDEIIIEEPKETTHTIVSGDTLWDIAVKYYGKGDDYLYIAAKNNIKTPLEIGQLIVIPTEEEKQNLDIKPFIPTPTPKPVTKTTSEKTSQASSTVINGKNMRYYTTAKITGYNPWCAHCCGKSDGITASGVPAKLGTTVAMTGVSFGTQVYIEGYGYYTVHDRGAFGKSHVDIACASHDDCYKITGKAKVYIVE